MDDCRLIEELYRRFHLAPATAYSDRCANLQIGDLPFKDSDGAAFGNVQHLLHGEDKSGAAFDIFRLGWFGGRLWELVIIDGAYVPHIHRKVDSEFVIFAGRGHLSRNAEWLPYREKSRIFIGMTIAHGFITDPEFGPTVFLSIQSQAIRQIVVEPHTRSVMSRDDFVYADDAFPLPADLLASRKWKLANGAKETR